MIRKLHNKTVAVIRNLYFLYLALLPSLAMFTFGIAYPDPVFNIPEAVYVVAGIGAFVAIFFYFACFSIYHFPNTLWGALKVVFFPIIPLIINLFIGKIGATEVAQFFFFNFLIIATGFYLMLFSKFKSHQPDGMSAGVISVTYLSLIFLMLPPIVQNERWWTIVLLITAVIGQSFMFIRTYDKGVGEGQQAGAVIYIIIGALSLFLIPMGIAIIGGLFFN